MTTMTPSRATVSSPVQPVVALKRRTLDSILISVGGVLTAALFVAGALLTWGSHFAGGYVNDELSSQHVAFPPAAALTQEGRTDLTQWGGAKVNTGAEAQAYASYINGHLKGIGQGKTYADLGAAEFAARDAVTAAKADGSSPDKVASLQAKYDAVSGQRNTLFKGETLRGLLLTAFAWATVGRIAGYAAFGAFLAGAAMLVLVVLGLRHHHDVVQHS